MNKSHSLNTTICFAEWEQGWGEESRRIPQDLANTETGRYLPLFHLCSQLHKLRSYYQAFSNGNKVSCQSSFKISKQHVFQGITIPLQTSQFPQLPCYIKFYSLGKTSQFNRSPLLCVLEMKMMSQNIYTTISRE